MKGFNPVAWEWRQKALNALFIQACLKRELASLGLDAYLRASQKPFPAEYEKLFQANFMELLA